MVDKFSEWLKSEMAARDLSQSDLGRMAGVTRSAINGVLTGARNPGVELCRAIAEAFNISPVTVFRKAGLLPEKPDTEVTFEDWEYLLAQLSPRDQEILRKTALTMLEADKKSGTASAQLNGAPVKP